MKWLLSESNFTFNDRLKICSFFLNRKKFWTMADEVAKYEKKMAKYVGSKYSVFVSSGSTANALIAMYLRDKSDNQKNVVVFPSTTWITSVSRFIREGFTPQFIDISIDNLGMDVEKLEAYLEKNADKVACVFVTSLLGFSPNIEALQTLKKKYNVEIMLDNCESTLTSYNGKNISSYFTSTTSTYFGHLLQSVEGGFIFTDDIKEYEYFLMSRNHGMTRSLSSNREAYSNPDVDPRFDFRFLGDNYRNTNINAFIGQLDFNRVEDYTGARKKLYDYFVERCEVHEKNILLVKRNDGDVPFSLPLIFSNQEIKKSVEEYCFKNGIETRPIISGNLLRQTCLKKYGNADEFKNSEFIHKNGMYVGLHSKVKEKDIEALVKNF